MDKSLVKVEELDWAPDGQLHERFKEWKKKVDLLCWRAVKNPKVKEEEDKKIEQQFCCRWITQLAGKYGEQVIDKALKDKGVIKEANINYEEYLTVLEN